MTRFSMRVALVMICLAASASAAFLIWTSEQQARTLQSSVNAFASTTHAARVAVSDLRGAQQGYVAAGQGPDFWFARVTGIVGDLHDRLASLKSLAASPEASIAIEDAAGALQDFDQVDRRARDLVRGRQLPAASDLIFADGFDLTKKAGDAIDRALAAELADRTGVLDFLKRRERYALASGSVVAAIVLVLLAPLPGRKVDAPAAAVPAAEPAPAISREAFADLDGLDAVPPHAAPAAPEPEVDMAGVAEVCADLAKVTDTRALPEILGRAASLLDATGLVVWIADPDGRELAPILVHGYPPQLATRLGMIARDAANVTASAYRTGLLQTVKGDSVSDGAIAAPLVSATGCLGVLAAEMRNGGEQRQALLSAAEIIAAQLSMLVGPPSARPARTEVAG
jgi:hypothetical protein